MAEKLRGITLEEEYKKKTGILPSDISKLREWLLTQPHLPGEHITDLDLILTYHCCSRSSEVSKQLLDLHFTMRTHFSSFFKNRYFDDKIRLVLEKVLLLTPLPTCTPEGYGIFFTHFLDRDPKLFVLSDCYRAGIMMIDLWQYQIGTQPGMLMLVDLAGMTLGHLARLDIQSVQQFLYYLQEALLVNLKGLHFLNAPSFMDRLMMIIRPFLNKSLMSMLHIHEVGSKTLDQFFPMEDLPKGAGGSGTSVEDLRDDCLAKLSASAEFFSAENKKRVAEARRPGRPKTISDIFGGVEGSFKKLDID